MKEMNQCGYYAYYNYMALQKVHKSDTAKKIGELGVHLQQQQQQKQKKQSAFQEMLKLLREVTEASTNRKEFAICFKDLCVQLACNRFEEVFLKYDGKSYQSQILDLEAPDILAFGLVKDEESGWCEVESKVHPPPGTFKPALYSSEWTAHALASTHYDFHFPNWKEDLSLLRSEACHCFLFHYKYQGKEQEFEHWIACCLLQNKGLLN